jgi:hypothetical protein
VRWLELLGLVSLAPAFWLLSRRGVGDGRAAALATLLAFLTYVPLGFWDTAQPEGFGGMLLVWALVIVTAPGGSPVRRAAAWIAAGALYGAAGLLKPHLGAGVLVSAAFLASERRQGRIQWLPVALLALGAALPVAATVAWLGAKGALGAMNEALFVFAPRYTELNLAEPGWVGLLADSATPLLRFATPTLVGLVAFAALPPAAPGERRLAAHALGVAAVVLAGVALQAKFFPYHYAALLLLLALPAGWGFWKLWLAVADRPAGWLGYALLLAVLALPLHPGGRQLALFRQQSQLRLAATRLLPPEREALRDRLHSLADVDAASNRRAARWLAENTAPEEPIYVWGFEPEIYVLAGRRPASRFVYNVPQRADWSAAAARTELLAELAQQPPAAIVLVRNDRFPHVTGNEQDGEEALRGFPALSRRVQREYVPAARFGDLEIRRRADAHLSADGG